MKMKATIPINRTYLFFYFIGSLIPLFLFLLGVFLVGSKTREIRRSVFLVLDEGSPILFSFVGLAFILVFLLGVWIFNSIMSPISEISQNVNKMMEGENISSPVENRQDQWGDLANLLAKFNKQRKKEGEKYQKNMEVLQNRLENITENITLLQSQKKSDTKNSHLLNSSSKLGNFFLPLEESLADSREALKKLKEISDNMAPCRKNIASLQKQADHISQEWEEIEDFQEETEEETYKIYLLFLNASIEAARFGEQGKGVEVLSKELQAMHHRLEENKQEKESSFGELEQHIASISTFPSVFSEIFQKAEEFLLEIISHGEQIGDTGRLFLEKLLTQHSISLTAHLEDSKGKKEGELLENIQKDIKKLQSIQ